MTTATATPEPGCLGGHSKTKKGRGIRSPFLYVPLPERWSRTGAQPPILLEDREEQWGDPYGHPLPRTNP